MPFFAQGVSLSTETGYLDVSGSKIDLDYDSGEKEGLRRTDIRVDGELAKKGVESEDTFRYDGKLDEYKNVTLNIIKNGNNITENIDKDLVKLETDFKGFFLDGEKVERVIHYRELDDTNVKISIRKFNGVNRSQTTGFTGEDFEVKSVEGDTEAELRLAKRSISPYVLEFESIPLMDVGTSEYTITMKDGTEIATFSIEKRATFEGRILEKAGNGERINFRLIDDSVTKFQSDKDGFFSKLVESDTINKKLKVDLGRVKTTFSGINISSGDRENIRYQFYRSLNPSDIQTGQLIRPVNMIAFHTDYPIDIEETSVRMEYNTSGINPEEIRIYECPYWDFFGERCRVEWGEKSIEEQDKRPLQGEIIIDDLETRGDGRYGLKSSYVAGIEYERPEINLKDSILPEERRYNVEDTLLLEGNLQNSKTGEPVRNAEVEVELSKDNNSSVSTSRSGENSLTTTDEGLFSFTPLEIPDRTGNYSISITAEKKGFNNLSETYEDTILVQKERSLSASGPERSAKPGERNTMVLSLENTGQAPVKDISIEESNIDDRYYTLSPNRIDKLGQGESASATLITTLPSDYCEENNCEKKELEISFEGVSEGESPSAKSKISITDTDRKAGNTQEIQEENESNTDTENKTGSKGNASELSGESGEDSNADQVITGNFFQEDNSSLKVSLGLIAFILLLLVIIAKKKSTTRNSTKDEDRTGSVVNKVKNVAGKAKTSIKELGDNNIRGDKEVKDLSDQGGSSEYEKTSNIRRKNVSKPKISPDQAKTIDSSGNESHREEEDAEENNNGAEKTNDQSSASETENSSEEGVYICNKCEEEYKTEKRLDLHMKHNH
ncbi:MAG: hypothetical protein J07AB43_06630 [Candidatus Nanosalina sp. J07AB43]|nr:MAG: hypothetical protein J07AB43_06630 [Candidatus Nanosalina sp. J07AB43]